MKWRDRIFGSRGDADRGPIKFPTASPGQKLIEGESAVTIDSKSTANGTRTRTLRLERAK